LPGLKEPPVKGRKKKGPKLRPKKDKQPAVRNIRKLALDLGTSRQTLYTWQKEGCPLDQGLEAVKEWRNKHKTNGEEATHYARLQAAKERKLLAEALAKETENLRRAGQYYRAEDVELAAIELTSIIRNRLEAAPNEIVQELPVEVRQTILELLQNKVHLILTEMSSWRLTT